MEVRAPQGPSLRVRKWSTVNQIFGGATSVPGLRLTGGHRSCPPLPTFGFPQHDQIHLLSSPIKIGWTRTYSSVITMLSSIT
jgi:hypothetical protein